MPFGMVRGVGRGMDVLDGDGDRRRGRGEFAASHCNQWGLCDALFSTYFEDLLLLLLCSKRKRTCRLDLGGHCATENAVAVADNWHYLNSHLSPGRRKRHAQQPHLRSDRDAPPQPM